MVTSRRAVAPRTRLVAILPPARAEALPAATGTIVEGASALAGAVGPVIPDADLDGPLRSAPGGASALAAVAPSAAAEPIRLAALPGTDLGGTRLGPAVAVLPPLRPSLPEEVPATAEDAATAAPSLAVLPPPRPALPAAAAPQPQVAALPDVPATAPAQAPSSGGGLLSSLFGSFAPSVPTVEASEPPISSGRSALDARIRHHAKLNGVPEALVHRIVIRESKYNPRAVGQGGAMGLMQIKTATARGLGYTGGPAGLLDAETNLTYAVKYLAGAYRTAGGNFDRAVSFYARGYYYAAKKKGTLETAKRDEADDAPAAAQPPGVIWNTAAITSGSSAQ
ncbi:MAG: lytic transglycosylase domain-containing protein [Methylobacteriaceae bacterium]|nr:lytic transglycosylase domain-containing protein [Methylobacteriaceae bacterium]